MDTNCILAERRAMNAGVRLTPRPGGFIWVSRSKDSKERVKPESRSKDSKERVLHRRRCTSRQPWMIETGKHAVVQLLASRHSERRRLSVLCFNRVCLSVSDAIISICHRIKDIWTRCFFPLQIHQVVGSLSTSLGGWLNRAAQARVLTNVFQNYNN